MFIVERQPNARDDRFIVRSKEPGTGFRGWKMKDLTLAEAQLAVEHYFAGHTDNPDCALCRSSS